MFKILVEYVRETAIIGLLYVLDYSCSQVRQLATATVVIPQKKHNAIASKAKLTCRRTFTFYSLTNAST